MRRHTEGILLMVAVAAVLFGFVAVVLPPFAALASAFSRFHP